MHCERIFEAQTFERWLSRDVVELLISEYANTNESFGRLTWEYSDKLPRNYWGMYVIQRRKLFVSKAKTSDKFKQQVSTILHEIQHWNQHVKHGHDFAINYEMQRAMDGYKNAPYEIEARAFAAEKLQEAMSKISEHYSGTIDNTGTTLEDVVMELMEEYIDGGEEPLTMLQIGTLLRDYRMNNADNVKAVRAALRDVGVKIV